MSCDKCTNKFVDKSLLILSHFPLLIHYINNAYGCNHNTALQDILTNCKMLKYLTLKQDVIVLHTLVLSICNLQQLCVDSSVADLSDTFMKAISSHGGLVHVVLCVDSVTTNGAHVLVENSPELMTFHAYIDFFDPKTYTT